MVGDFAVAVRTGNGWVLKELCPPDERALAVRVGDGWGLAPLGVSGNGRYLAVRTAAATALLPLQCPEDEDEPCTGTDPLCSICDCAAELAESYQVSISGFPAICGVETFNGSWVLTWRSECVWQCDIDEYRSVRLSGQAGPFWRITWAVASAGGLSGYFGGLDGEACAPETQDYYFWQVSSTIGCTGLADALMDDVAMVLSRV